VPLLAQDRFVKLASGVKLKVYLESYINQEFLENVSDDILFTPFGVSGSGILRLSANIARELKRNPNSSIEVKINFLPLLSKEDLIAKLDKLQKEKLWIIMLGILPQKLVDAILSCAEIDSEINIEDLTIEQRKKLFDNLYDKKIQISGTKGWPEAEFTSGGISIKEIDENSMESKLQKGLFFAGEILNVDGEIGGYNLSWAWASGAIAGISSAS
jgi:predicted Rossmann fold flavoprotein